MTRSLVLLALLMACPRRPTPEPAPDETETPEPAEPSVLHREITDARALTRDDLQEIVDALVPLVEEAAGATFETPPVVQLGTADALEEILVEEARTIVSQLYEAPDEVLEKMARDARASVPAVVGKYAIATEQLYLSRDAIARMVAANGWPDTWSGPCAILVLAHEMAHTLQDQEADLEGGFSSLRDKDHFDGLRGATEGHANLVEEAVARKLDWMEIYDAMNASQGWNADGPIHPGAFEVWALYGVGRSFVRHHFDAGGTEAAWRVVREPPATTTMLWSPADYAPTIQAPRDYASLLRGIETVLTRGDWTVINSHLGEMSLRRESLGIEKVALADVLSHIAWGHELVAHRPGREARVRILEFDQPEAPYRYIELLSSSQEEMAAALSQAGQPWSVTVTPYDAVEGDAVIRRVTAPEGPHPSSMERQSVWVVRDKRLVVVDVEGFRPGLRMNWALEKIYERLDAP